MKPFYAYLITNKVNGRQYIGITKKTVEVRWNSHVRAALKGKSSRISVAIRKYGQDAFDVQPLLCCTDYAALMEYEVALIASYNTMKPNGYNLTLGGGGMPGFKFSDESRKKMSNSRMGIVLSEETKAKMSAYWTGRPKNDGRGAKISAAKKGMPRSPETIAKVSLALKARYKEFGVPKQSKENIEKRIASWRANYEADKAAGIERKIGCGGGAMKGKKQTLETRAKMSASGKAAWAHRKLRAEVKMLAAAGCHA